MNALKIRKAQERILWAVEHPRIGKKELPATEKAILAGLRSDDSSRQEVHHAKES